MAGGNGAGRKPPLVAERRYGRGAAGAKTAAKATKTTKAASPRRRAAPAPRRARRGPLGWLVGLVSGLVWFVWRVIWGVGWRLAAVTALLIGGGVTYYAAQMPDVAQLVDGRARGSVTLLDRDGQPFAWRGDQFAGMVTADGVSVHLRNAVVATEDRRFYWHPGIDPQGIASAIRINLRKGRGPLSGNGGSTITQQTAKLLCLGRPFDPAIWEDEAAYEEDCRRTTLWRKVQEAVFAMAMEVRYSKDDILTLYFNRAYLGAGTRGFEAASQRYFGHSASEVTPAEAAMLAGLLKAPTTYAPTNSLQRATDRANVVIGLMEEQGYLSASAAAEARERPAQLSAQARERSGGFFADWVMEQAPYGFADDTTEDVIITTTLDRRIQRAAEEALVSVFETQVREGSEAQAAIVVMSADGAVRAMVGGRNIEATGAFNRATQALRQTGSSFKPFVYAAALDQGMVPDDVIDDSPLTINIPGSRPWSPQNYDREFKGLVSLTQALAESRNIPAVRLSEMVGRDNVRAVAEGFGLDADMAEGPALALGASESTLIAMTGAYAGILNGGSSVTPYGLSALRLQGDDAPLIDQTSGIGERVIMEEAARELVWMMSQVVENGTGQRARIEGWEIAGKTGTTQLARDAWFIGFTGDYVAGVWMGYDDNQPLTGVTGGGLPAEIWREAMVRVLDGMTPVPLPMQPPSGAPGSFVDPGGLAAEGEGPITGTDPALDAALAEAFGEPQIPAATGAEATQREDAVLNALDAILNGQ